MTWNYRILQIHDNVYEIIEVYYDESENIDSWTVNTMKPSGETKVELAADIEMMLAAQLHPVLIESDAGDKLIELDF